MRDLSLKEKVFGALRGTKIDKTPVTSVADCGGTVNVDVQKAVGIYWPEAHKDAGLRKVKLGNLVMFVKSSEEYEMLAEVDAI